ncbi:GlxA family transcriptional regulator [Roseateles toxinivorans]|uniref:Transcriptional regulator GlxA family with amidase domain n=1 Tax=Roseateles toxinivorans TaxID=270368 RepID=A0A4V3CTA9_9BURK|nr:helix-turn-helix domain-containing protein [Roseateles toxinivorans]TDP71127.1 transcriptional regulator GlxA family with amidase domain [Roseateles toxinivorans]
MIDLLFLVLPGSLLLDLAGPAEAFRLANRHLEQRGKPAAFRLRYLSPAPEAISSVGLMLSGLEPLPEQLPKASWTVLLGQRGQLLQDRQMLRSPAWQAVRLWLGRLIAPRLLEADSPHRLLSVCAGALLAADAGLLARRHCTTHHEMLATLQDLAPTAEVVNNRVFVIDGPVASSAGVTAGIDLALHLIAGECGEDITAAVAQDMVVYLRRGPRDPELSPLLQHRNHLHPAVHRVQDAITRQPAEDWSLQRMAAQGAVTPRHLSRLFATHAQVTPLHYLQNIRLEHARQALARGASVTQAALDAGFSSDQQMRRAAARLS